MKNENKNTNIDIDQISGPDTSFNPHLDEETKSFNDEKDKEINLDSINLGESILEDVIEEKEVKKQEVKEGDSKTKESKYKYVIYLFLILGLTALVLWFNLTQPAVDMNGNVVQVYQTLPSIMNTLNPWYFLMFFGFIILTYFISSLILWLFARLYTKHYKYHQALANNCIGQFYSAVTPGASGGQFAQIYVFKKQGIPVAHSASIFVMSFVILQSCLIIFGLVSLVFRFEAIMAINIIPITIGELTIDIPIWIFILFGFVVNVAVIGLLLFMSYSRHFQNFVLNFCINFLAKIHILKNPTETRNNLRIQVENFRIELRRLQSNIPFTLLVLFLTALNMFISNLAPFFVGLALDGFTMETLDIGSKIFDSIAFLNFHQMATGLIPLPGSAGVSEIVFGSLFGQTSNFYTQDFYKKGAFNVVILIWRFATFYIPFLVNGIIAATYKSRGLSVKDRIIPVGNRKTMLTIQLQTYQERKVTSDTMYETKALERKELLQKLTTKINVVKKDKTKEINTKRTPEYKDEIIDIGKKGKK